MCKAIGYDSLSELPGFLLGTSWTVRSRMLMYREGKKNLGRLPASWAATYALPFVWVKRCTDVPCTEQRAWT